MKILIIEDEKRLAQTLAALLRQAGYSADTAGNGLTGLDQIRNGNYDAAILDVMLPGMNGFDVLRQLRTDGYDLPVLMLTARSDLSDRVRGLTSGADYYLTKPFENEELLACLAAILRRGTAAPPMSDILKFGDLILNLSTSTLACDEANVALSARELDLMKLLIQSGGRLLSKEQILDQVWGYDADVNANSVEAYISFLRKKLSHLSSHVRITVARNLGYKLEVTP